MQSGTDVRLAGALISGQRGSLRNDREAYVDDTWKQELYSAITGSGAFAQGSYTPRSYRFVEILWKNSR